MVEDIRVSQPYRCAYEEGIRKVIENRRIEADAARKAYAAPQSVAANPEHYRQELRQMLGWPLSEASHKTTQMTICEEKLLEPGILMQRLQFEVLPGLPFYGILLIPQAKAEKMPLIISQHGGWGTPEQTADLHMPNNYKSLSLQLARKGCVVFAPQLLLWLEAEEMEGRVAYGLKHHRAEHENELRQLGGSMAALEVYSIICAIDCLSVLPQVDNARIGMIGLSYGGFYTQLTAALDTRIKAAVSNAFFNERYRYCWHDFSWLGSAFRMLDAEICGLIAPRPLCIHVGTNDKVFDYSGAVREFERLKPYYENVPENLYFLLSDVNHTLTDSGEEMEFLLKHL